MVILRCSCLDSVWPVDQCFATSQLWNFVGDSFGHHPALLSGFFSATFFGLGRHTDLFTLGLLHHFGHIHQLLVADSFLLCVALALCHRWAVVVSERNWECAEVADKSQPSNLWWMILCFYGMRGIVEIVLISLVFMPARANSFADWFWPPASTNPAIVQKRDGTNFSWMRGVHLLEGFEDFSIKT